MTTTADKIKAREHVQFYDDERAEGNSLIITLKDGYYFKNEPDCGVQGFDNVKDAEVGTRESAVFFKKEQKRERSSGG